jgi:hypothetical protein
MPAAASHDRHRANFPMQLPVSEVRIVKLQVLRWLHSPLLEILQNLVDQTHAI